LIAQSINHWFIKTDDKPQPLKTVDNKITTIKRKIMNKLGLKVKRTFTRTV